MIVVSDSSSISALLRIGHCDLLQQLYGSVFIPQVVQNELKVFFNQLPEFLQVRKISDIQKVEHLCADLDEGEAEAIVLAKEIGADVLLIDERIGRRVAEREGVPIIGLMGVLVQAKKEGLISQVQSLITRLEQETDFRLSAELKKITLQQAQEL